MKNFKFILLALIAFSFIESKAQTPISGLPELTSPNDTDVLVIVNDGVTKKIQSKNLLQETYTAAEQIGNFLYLFKANDTTIIEFPASSSFWETNSTSLTNTVNKDIVFSSSQGNVYLKNENNDQYLRFDNDYIGDDYSLRYSGDGKDFQLIGGDINGNVIIGYNSDAIAISTPLPLKNDDYILGISNGGIVSKRVLNTECQYTDTIFNIKNSYGFTLDYRLIGCYAFKDLGEDNYYINGQIDTLINNIDNQFSGGADPIDTSITPQSVDYILHADLDSVQAAGMESPVSGKVLEGKNSETEYIIEAKEVSLQTTSGNAEFHLDDNEGGINSEYFEVNVDNLSFNNLSQDDSKTYLLGFNNSYGGYVSSVAASNYKSVPMKYNEVNVDDGDTINITQKTSLLRHTLNIGDTIDVYLDAGDDYYTDLYIGSCCATGVIRLNSLAASPQGFPMYLNGYELVEVVTVAWQQFAIKEKELE